MNKLKQLIKSCLKQESFIYKAIRKIYHILSTLKYKVVNCKKEKQERKVYNKQLNDAIKIIKEKYENAEYIVLYNPTWLGVANSTKGLFENIVPLQQVFGRKNVKKISNAILQSNIKQVIFSQIVDGWTDVLKNIKDKNKDIIIKVIWHANNYEVLSDYTWQLNKNVLELYNKEYINCFAFVKKNMAEFYKEAGYRTSYITNNVNTTGIQKKLTKKVDFNNIKVGVYNANSRELKNAYTQLSAIKYTENATADIVPTNEAILKFASIIKLKYTSLPDYIPTKTLLERCQENDINLYITYTECSPMFPLESFEVGVPCLVGNNNDYFQDTELGKYVIIDREDDAEYISKKIMKCLENKEEIMKLYNEWKKQYDKKCKKYVKEFIVK